MINQCHLKQLFFEKYTSDIANTIIVKFGEIGEISPNLAAKVSCHMRSQLHDSSLISQNFHLNTLIIRFRTHHRLFKFRAFNFFQNFSSF